MPTTSVPLHALDSADGSPGDRARAVAAILAAGLLRLRKPVAPADGPAPPPPEILSDSRANQLAEPGEKSVTVSAG